MQYLEKPYIVYTLPNNKVDQRLKNNKLEICWKDIDNFIYNVTNTNILEPKEIRLDVFTYNNIIEPEKSFTYYNQEIMDNTDFELLIENNIKSIRKGEWVLKKDILLFAKDFFSKYQSKIKSNSDISLRLYYNFYLKEYKSASELPNQKLLSSITFYFSKDIKCSLDLFFPFENANTEFWNYFDNIKHFIPVEVDEKYLRQSRIKNGKVTSFKKISRFEK